MAKLWDKIRHSNAKAYMSYFGRGILAVVAVLVIAGLIALSFYYGNRKHSESTPAPTATSAHDQSSASGGSSSTHSHSSPATHKRNSNSGSVAVTGPTTVANTGPKDFLAPLVATSLILLLVKYKRGERALGRGLSS